jgi:predicted ABC-type ATPase
VLAGPNGGGKSSIAGAMIRQAGADYFNPDEHARRLMERHPSLLLERANALAWEQGRARLEEAIANRRTFAFETTLGGKTMSRLLLRAGQGGMAVRIWYVALASADDHVARVKARAARGGHDIPEQRVRARYDASRANLARLIPWLAALKVYDNSQEVDVEQGEPPRLRMVLDMVGGRIRDKQDLAGTPQWAKPIVAAALKAERA